jgi:predicted dehydrogenase
MISRLKNMKTIKAAVVGAGKMGLVHASILSTLTNVQLVGLCDKSALIRKLLSKMVGKQRVFEDIGDLLNLDCEMVFVTTPIPSHYSIVKEIYDHNENMSIFVEKTLSTSYGNSLELSNLSQNSNGKNMVGYMKRFGMTFQKTKELLNQNLIGDVISFDAHAFSSDFYGVHSSQTSDRGGVLSDLGSHIIDLSLSLFGNFEIKKSASRSNQLIEFTGEYADQIEGHFKVSWSEQGYHVPEFALSIRGKKGTISVNDDMVNLTTDGESKIWYRHNLNDNVGFLLGAPEYYREDQAFLNAILTGQKLESDFSSAVKTDYIIERALEEKD